MVKSRNYKQKLYSVKYRGRLLILNFALVFLFFAGPALDTIEAQKTAGVDQGHEIKQIETKDWTCGCHAPQCLLDL